MQSTLEKKTDDHHEDENVYLEVKNLVIKFYTNRGIVKAIDNISFKVKEGEVFGMVGESGCGKSVTALSVMDLIPYPLGRIESGKVKIDGFNIYSDIKDIDEIKIKNETKVKIKRKKKALKKHNYILTRIRGKKASMIFQEPTLSLNPVLRVGEQITETILSHNKGSIANSLVNRAQLSAEDVRILVSEVKVNTNNTKSIVDQWCRRNAVEDIEDQVLSIFKNYDDDNDIIREIVEKLVETFGTLDIKGMEDARDYYIYKERIESLELRSLAARDNLDFELMRQFQNEYNELQQTEGVKFRLIKFKKIFSGRKVEKIFRMEANRKAKELLTLVNLPDPDRIMRSYPHELSGGMQQRLMIAIAIACDPKLLIADEPTTALDVTTQAQILNLLKNLNKTVGSSILFITHDLAVVADICDRVAVMYAGCIVEEGEVADIFKMPKHPYTVGLLKAIPEAGSEKGLTLQTIPGSVPNLITPPMGCRFHPRCSFAMPICSESKPNLEEIASGHKVACFLYSSEVEK